MKKIKILIIAALVTCFAQSGYSNVTLEFGTMSGGNQGTIYGSAGSMNLDLGDLALTNPLDTELNGSVVMISIMGIGNKTASLPSSAQYDLTVTHPVMGIQLMNDVDGDGNMELILSGDLQLDDLLTIVSSGHVDPTQSVNVTNISLHNSSMMMSQWGFIPSQLTDLVNASTADFLVNLSASGYDLTQSIDSGSDIVNIEVTGSLTAPVPEPISMLLFGFGALFMGKKIRYRS